MLVRKVGQLYLFWERNLSYNTVGVCQCPDLNFGSVYVLEEFPNLLVVRDHLFEWKSLVTFTIKVQWIYGEKRYQRVNLRYMGK